MICAKIKHCDEVVLMEACALVKLVVVVVVEVRVVVVGIVVVTIAVPHCDVTSCG